jgi:hypothetical protein
VKRVAPALALALLTGCAMMRPPAPPPAQDDAIEQALRKDIAVLASDDFGGRRPGTEGEAKTLRYLANEWQAAGLESGTNDPAHPWFAPVELALSTPNSGRLRFERAGREVVLPAGSAVVFGSGIRELVERAPVLFVGEAGETLDRAELAGRVALMLWDHPGQAEQREALLDKGASAVLAIVATQAELDAIAGQRQRGNYRLAGADDAGLVDGYITADAAAALIGADRLAALRQAAGASDFSPVSIAVTATLEATSTPGTVRTHNLIARLPGKKPGSGVVLLLAHWDHFGQCAEPPATDLICNGAVDNASGLAVLSELARRLAAGPRMDRDVYFMATTGEEWGLLGAQAFAQNPPVPLDTIVAAFNLDTVAVAPRGSPVAVIGAGMTRLDADVDEVIRESGRKLADDTLAKEFVRRQDGWALLQRDVPAISVTSTFAQAEPVGHYLATRYHQPSDEVEGIELGGAADDTRLHLALVRFFADTERYPTPAR